MHKKVTPFLLLSLAIAISTLAPITHAQLSIGALADTSGQLGYDTRSSNASSSAREASTTDETLANATTSANKDANNQNASTSESITGQLIAEAHQSTVTSFVQSLLTIAEKDGDRGAQVRIIAESQKDSAAAMTDALDKIASRNSLQTLFFGSDYKNLGILRSKMLQTQNHLAQLSVILSSTTDATDRATLITQINALSLDQVNIQDFVTAHENSFSFFGWFVKLI